MYFINDEAEWLRILAEIRWNGNVCSPFNPLSKVYHCGNGKFRCQNSKKYFTAKTKSIFENSRLPISVWMIALETYHLNRNITATDIAEKCNISVKSAALLLKKIRNTHPQAKNGPPQNADKLNLSKWFEILRK